MKISTATMLLDYSTKGLVTLGLVSGLTLLAACGPQISTTTTEQTTTRQVAPMPMSTTTTTTTQRTTP